MFCIKNTFNTCVLYTLTSWCSLNFKTHCVDFCGDLFSCIRGIQPFLEERTNLRLWSLFRLRLIGSTICLVQFLIWLCTSEYHNFWNTERWHWQSLNWNQTIVTVTEMTSKVVSKGKSITMKINHYEISD